MTRDDDYLRDLLLEMEASKDWAHVSVLTGRKDQELKRHFHIMLLVDAGFLAPMSQGASSFRITNDGYDFIALTRRNEAWEATKGAARHLGGASVQMLYRVAEGYAQQKLAELGVPIGWRS